MKCYLATLVLAGLVPTLLHGEEAGPVPNQPVRESGYTPMPKGVQSFSVSSYSYGEPTNFEQLMLELINRARADPGAEAQRLGINLNQGLPGGTISDTPKPPLAFQSALIASARDHTQWMLDNDVFSHTGTNGSSATQRMTSAGYLFTGSWVSGENIVWRGTTGTVDVEQFTRGLHDDLFKSPGHRQNILAADFDQVGLGILQGNFLSSGTNWNALMGTQDYASSASSPSPDGPLVLGVAYEDNNGNGFYDPGEGLGGVTVNLLPGDTTTTTSASGGYAIPLGTTSGALILTFSGGAVPQATQVAALAVPGINLKVDLVLGGPPAPAASVALTGNLAFGDVKVGTSETRILTISNPGTLPLIVSGLTHSAGAFTGNLATTISPGRSKDVTVTFTPAAIASYSGTLTVLSNATSGTSTLAETGTGATISTVTAPEFLPGGGAFTTSIKVKISSPTTKAIIRYTLDGTEPTALSRKCSKTITLKASATVKARAFKTGYTESTTTSGTFTKN